MRSIAKRIAVQPLKLQDLQIGAGERVWRGIEMCTYQGSSWSQPGSRRRGHEPGSSVHPQAQPSISSARISCKRSHLPAKAQPPQERSLPATNSAIDQQRASLLPARTANHTPQEQERSLPPASAAIHQQQA